MMSRVYDGVYGGVYEANPEYVEVQVRGGGEVLKI